MTIAPLTLKENYWETININEEDLEYLYNYLLEIEIPQTTGELTKVLIQERIRQEKENLKNKQSGSGEIYKPMDRHAAGDKLSFPVFNWSSGKVIDVREV